LIVGNTTTSRPALASSHRGEAGGLSGAPLKRLALHATRLAFVHPRGGRVSFESPMPAAFGRRA